MQLMRADKPIGSLLLFWPTLWALLVSSNGLPDPWITFVFFAGVFLMRSAGCVINDYADRHWDKHVERTQDRPLTSGRISEREALTLFGGLVAAAFVLVCFTNLTTVLLSIVAVLLAASYPFMKRFHHLPQVVLGAAFGGLLVVYALGGRPREPLAIAMIVVASSVAIGWRLSGLNATIFEVLPALVSAWLVYGVGRVCGLSGPAK